MIRKSLFAAAFIAATSASAQWIAPEYSGSYQALTPADTVYIYNTEAKQFLTEGNDWGTHASVGLSGLKFCINQYAAEGAEWDGQTYTIGVHSEKKGADYIMFFEAGGNIYVDGSTSKSDFLFSFKDNGNNTYQIVGAEGNPTFNASGENAGYVVGRYTKYVNTRDGIESGTGVIYDYNGTDNAFAEGEFQTSWAFVSKDDYAAYQEKVATYNSAQKLGEMLTAAETLGVPDIAAEKAVYTNTSSTKSDIDDAIASLEKKTLAYYEVVITPDNPITIVADECNAITDWTNGINASTWNTQTWIDGSWTGFEGTTLNIWGASANGKAYRELTDLPNGIYVVSMAVYSEKLDGYAFANENQKAVAGAAAGNVYEVTTEVSEGTLKFGFGQDETGTNWIALDNATVKYYGAGVEAYRYWLSGLLASAPKFDEAVAQNSLVEEYNGVLASVNTATTKDDILAIIPSYEEVLNRVNLNIAAYEALKTAIGNADLMSANENINTYYGDKLGDIANDKNEIVENHTLSTEDVQAATTEVTTLIQEAQNYLWNVEKFTSEKETAAGIYAEYGSVCAPSAADAYNDFVAKDIDFSSLTNADMLALLDELYDIEFKLQVPAEAASDDNPVDYTAKVNYPSFDDGANGWTNDGWSTCGSNTWTSFADGEVIDAAYLNLWNETAATVSQTLSNIPNGTYMVQISAFADAAGVQVFANNDYMDVLVGQNENGAGSVIGVTTEPVDGSVWYGNIYQIITNVTDGTLKIGARQSVDSKVWAMIDNVKLTYFGTNSSKQPTAIKDAASNNASATAIYTANGIRTNSLSKGINIVKYADGSVRKVLVK